MTVLRISPRLDSNDKPQKRSDNTNQLQTVEIMRQREKNKNQTNANPYTQTISLTQIEFGGINVNMRK
jgi:hypothetical protein